MKRKIVFSIGTLNESIRAKRILAGEKINVNVVKLEESKSRNGCSYGIDFDERDLYSVVHLLSLKNIPYHNYI